MLKPSVPAIAIAIAVAVTSTAAHAGALDWKRLHAEKASASSYLQSNWNK